MSAAVVAASREGASGVTTTVEQTPPTSLSTLDAATRQQRTNENFDEGSASETDFKNTNGVSSAPLNRDQPDEKSREHPAELKDDSQTSAAVEIPLSSGLRRILLEVGQTGSCAALPWRAVSDLHVSSDMAAALSNKPVLALGSKEASSATPHAPPLPGNGIVEGTSPAKQRRSFLMHQPHANSHSIGSPPRKKQRSKGLYAKNTTSFSKSSPRGESGRKRPLQLIRTASSASSSVFSPQASSAGSEAEDTSQYECDSEGTSATSNSERQLTHSTGTNGRMWSSTKVPTGTTAEEAEGHISSAHDGGMATTTMVSTERLQYKSLVEVFRIALSVVLDHYFSHRGGYKLSPAEKRKQATKDESSKPAADISTPNGTGNNDTVSCGQSTAEEQFFLQRRQRLLSALDTSATRPTPPTALSAWSAEHGPPFTIQRIAEVLVAPERYYTQTHKLCNCLEKLLLVTSSVGAFGGSTGGVTIQSRREDRELAALKGETGRFQSQLRHQRLRRRASSSSSMSDENSLDGFDSASQRTARAENLREEAAVAKPALHSEKKDDPATSGEHQPTIESLEAAARASLRSKFDHVGIDPHHAVAVSNRDVRAIAENRGMTNSPPPPGLSMASGAGIPLPGPGGLLRQQTHHDQDHGRGRPPSPIFGESSSSSPPIRPIHANPNIHLLQMSHAAAVAGFSPFELVSLNVSHDTGSPMSPVGSAIPGLNREIDLESRSSASSDVDSESDVSFDDSASDRSDGSDSAREYESLTVSRAMALSRMQQQQRLQQTRLVAAAMHQNVNLTSTEAHDQHGTVDGVSDADAPNADDSGGDFSDSSSSDMAE